MVRAENAVVARQMDSPAELILAECFRNFCARPGAVLVERDGVIGAMTDLQVSFFNGVGTTRMDSPEALADVVEQFKAHKRPFRWWVSPSMTPPDLAERLQAHGLRHRWDSPAMDKMLTDPEPLEFPSGVTVEQIGAAKMPAWIDVLLRGFNIPAEQGAIWLDAYTNGGFDPATGWRHFLAYVDGEPMGITALLLRGTLAGIYHVVTLPAARNRGVGKAVMRAALEDARISGATAAALQSSELGLPLYRSLGFREHCMLSMYEWRDG
jgi:GNAT superfamily N-acetyltransferase